MNMEMTFGWMLTASGLLLQRVGIVKERIKCHVRRMSHCQWIEIAAEACDEIEGSNLLLIIGCILVPVYLFVRAVKLKSAWKFLPLIVWCALFFFDDVIIRIVQGLWPQ